MINTAQVMAMELLVELETTVTPAARTAMLVVPVPEPTAEPVVEQIVEQIVEPLVGLEVEPIATVVVYDQMDLLLVMVLVQLPVLVPAVVPVLVQLLPAQALVPVILTPMPPVLVIRPTRGRTTILLVYRAGLVDLPILMIATQMAPQFNVN